ncbi:MAG: transglycosylase SLT domain-containing protein [Bacteroidaceae bacterium]|nr:transglycosylase SLT domain-containing protein [Bacteroidaceae bacterium]MBO4841326.1 transglycosylase SLT domain-containing protein [Bacteroidaceae bacterium]
MKIRIYTFTCALLLAITAYAQEYTDTIGTDDTLLPEGMQMYELDSLLTDWMTRTYLTNVENCLSKGVNPSFSDETYAQRLSRLPNVIDMPYNDIVRKYIDRYCERLRPSVSIMLGACNFYNPIFEEALESYQVPLELRNLPIIESALHPNAVSRAGAVGLWQFMIGTAKRYGLEVTSLIDERKDPVKASYAAAHMLKDLYDIFGDWSLAIAAYNCGPGNVSKAIRRSGGRKDFWGIYQYLPAETRGYVPAFIAANYVMNYYCDHNICPVGTTLPQATDTLLLKKNVKMEQIAATCDISIDELRALNPQYRTTLIPGDSHDCILRMPSDKINAFIDAGDSIYVKQDYSSVVKEVTLTEDNDNGKTKGRNSKKNRRGKSGGGSITVKKGDTLGAIARRNGTSVSAIKKANGLKSDNIREGQKLRLN